MANSFALSRTHLIYGLCIPLAVVLGYLLASGTDTTSMALVVFVLCVICIPIMMRFHHPLLFFSCNALISPYFLPGRPMLWMVFAVISFFFAILDRSVGRNLDFFRARWVSISLIFLAAVVFFTAYIQGGIGFRMLGSTTYGGKKYFGLFAGIFLFFGMTAYPVKPERGKLYVALYFLSALTALVTFVAAIGGPSLYFLVELFPIETAVQQSMSSGPTFTGFQVTRLQDLSWVANGAFCFMMARYGVRGVLDLGRPWRLLLVGTALAAGAASGFRSVIITLGLTFAIMFWMERLYRTRYMVVLVIGTILAACIALPNLRHLPAAMQRSLAFLPLDIDPEVEMNAVGTSEWRFQMWREVLPQVPKHLLLGTGYALNPDEYFMVGQDVVSGQAGSFETAAAAGDYHNGPLSVVMPFGMLGVIAFSWFLAACVGVLRRNLRYGDPALQHLNTFLLAYFVVRIIGFILVFGSLHSDLMLFCSLIGLSITINGGVCQPPTEDAEEVSE